MLEVGCWRRGSDGGSNGHRWIDDLPQEQVDFARRTANAQLFAIWAQLFDRAISGARDAFIVECVRVEDAIVAAAAGPEVASVDAVRNAGSIAQPRSWSIRC